MIHPAFYIVVGFAAGTVFLGWYYFRHYALARPPIGVMNLSDVSVLGGAILLVPYLDLLLPQWLAAGFIIVASLSLMYLMLVPVLRVRWVSWVVTLSLTGANSYAALQQGTSGAPFLLINNIVQLLALVGLANLWAQSGMKARDATLLAGLIAFYDYIATVQTPLMDTLLTRRSQLQFVPLIAWDLAEGRHGLAVGFGDMLFVTVFPLVLRKAFGQLAGRIAMFVLLGVLTTMLLLLNLGFVKSAIPAMVIFGPLMLLQYGYWRWRRGPERTMAQYLQSEPLGGWMGTLAGYASSFRSAFRRSATRRSHH
jgi:hypothetical protein